MSTGDLRPPGTSAWQRRQEIHRSEAPSPSDGRQSKPTEGGRGQSGNDACNYCRCSRTQFCKQWRSESVSHLLTQRRSSQGGTKQFQECRRGARKDPAASEARNEGPFSPANFGRGTQRTVWRQQSRSPDIQVWGFASRRDAQRKHEAYFPVTPPWTTLELWHKTVLDEARMENRRPGLAKLLFHGFRGRRRPVQPLGSPSRHATVTFFVPELGECGMHFYL